MTDDINNKRFDNLDKKIDAGIADVRSEIKVLTGQVEDLDTKMPAEFHIVRNEMSLGFAAASDAVMIEQADTLGRKIGKLEERAESERDRKISELQTDLAATKANFARLEEMFLKVLGGGAKQ